MSYLEKKVQNGNEAAKAASRETKNTINTFPKLQLSPGLFKKKEKVREIFTKILPEKIFSAEKRND